MQRLSSKQPELRGRERQGVVGQNGNGAAPRQKLEKVVIRFAGDSGDGMQLTGDRFTSEAALFGNDLATQPNYPRRDPGTTGHPARCVVVPDPDRRLRHPDRRRPSRRARRDESRGAEGQRCRPAARRLIIANSDEFTKRNLAKVGYDSNPLESEELSDYVVQSVAMTTLTLGAVEAIGATKKDGQRAKNMFALGLLSWMYGRELEASEAFIREKFARKPEIAEANVLALKAGWNYGETTEAFAVTYEVAPAKLKTGEYRQISGNTALAYGVVAAGQLGDIQVVLGTYPITPGQRHPARAVEVQALQRAHLPGRGRDRRHRCGHRGGVLRWRPRRHQHVRTRRFAQVGGHRLGRDDRVAAARHRCAARRSVHRPADQDRTGRPAAGALRPQRRIAGRGAGSVLAVGLLRCRRRGRAHRDRLSHAGDHLVRRAIANGSEPWRIPDISTYPAIEHTFAEAGKPFQPYARDPPETLARQFAIPGTPGLEHRIGGLESANGSGNISYEPKNHDLMVRLRQAKIDGITVPDLEVDDPTGDASCCCSAGGSSYGPPSARPAGVPGATASRWRTLSCGT